MELNRIIQYNVLNTPWPLEDNCVDCCVTSPPYWGLRDYNNTDQIGQEKTPEEYVQKLVAVFTEVYRVLKPAGTLWLNLGDSFFKKGKLQKNMVGVPWMVAFALRNAGYYLRQDIIWSKPNPMPESVNDRCTKAHEYIFLLTKSKKYHYDAAAISQPLAESSKQRLAQNLELQKGSDRVPGKTNGNMKAVMNRKTDGANKRSVWTVATVPFKGAHFAPFPEALITPCVMAGCPKGGIVLDPFIGTGTTAIVALSNARKFIGLELNQDYIKLANERIYTQFGMFYNT